MNREKLRSLFLLNPEIRFLNFGSFGACPRPVFDDYIRWERELEAEPVQFIAVNGPGNLRRSREALGKYLNCEADDLVFVSNPSYAMNIVARCLGLKKGEEVLSTNIEYGACDRIFKYWTSEVGARYVRQPISLPVRSKESFLQEFFQGLNKNTRAVFIGQITSATALVLPVKEIIAEAKKRNLLTIVDGAHVPGQLPLDILELDPDIYTGACHKWMLTPKGCSFLYVRRALQAQFDPLVVSWGYENDKPSHSRFLDYHQMQGTRDFSAFLTVPAAIEFMKEWNWSEVARDCRKMVMQHAGRFCDLLETETLAPMNEAWFAQMLSLKINTTEPEKLQARLFNEYQIEIPLMRLNENCYLRYSINAFNTGSDLDALYDALKTMIEKGELKTNVRRQLS